MDVLAEIRLVEEEEQRAKKVEAAKRRLKTFRASRSSTPSHSQNPSSSSNKSSKSSKRSPAMPLSSDTAGNSVSHSRQNSTSKGKEKAHERQPSRHRRKPSSTGYFNTDVFSSIPSDIITIPPTPLPDDFIPEPPFPLLLQGEADANQVKERLSAFSFGDKSPRPSPIPKRRNHSSISIRAGDFSPPPSFSAPTNLHRLGTPSRPPSLLFTKASPLTASPAHRLSIDPPIAPSAPSTPSRRHSHTRSSSISLPNLKLTHRPNSLGVPSPTSFPSSPSSPSGSESDRPTLKSPLSGAKLKFEPSEAEIAKEESRRKALDKLNGSRDSSPVIAQQEVEISLPDLEDDFSSSISSSSSGRPLSGSSPFSNRPNSAPSPISTSPFTPWLEESHFGIEKWGLGVKEETGLGFDLPKRKSLTLAVLTEEDEEELPEESPVEEVKAPTGLKPLTLVSSTPIRTSSDSTSPTKGYGSIGRGRPDKLKHIPPYTSSSSPTTAIITPKSARIPKRSTTGRRSSISYRKDESISPGSSQSSRWSLTSGIKGVTSPVTTSDINDDQQEVLDGDSPKTKRPCPRPKSLTGLSFSDLSGSSNRILSELMEKEEEVNPLWNDGKLFFQSLSDTEELDNRKSLDKSEEPGWNDDILELKVQNEELKEDLNGWKERCLAAEEKVDMEKKENHLLRERIRKLSDRLLSISTQPPQSPGKSESRVVKEMRDQLFNLTTLLDKEKRENQDRQSRISELEIELKSLKLDTPPKAWDKNNEGNEAFDLPAFPGTLTFGQLSKSEYMSPTTPIITPATPVASHAESSLPKKDNFRVWGFPSSTQSSTYNKSTKSSKRESFFGLSKIPRRGSKESEQSSNTDESGEMGGIDLPPFVLPKHPGGDQFGRAFSDSATREKENRAGMEFERSVSWNDSTSTTPGVNREDATTRGGSPFSFISNYMKSSSSGTVPSKSAQFYASVESLTNRRVAENESTEKQFDDVKDKSGLDFRGKCHCCSGPTFEL